MVDPGIDILRSRGVEIDLPLVTDIRCLLIGALGNRHVLSPLAVGFACGGREGRRQPTADASFMGFFHASVCALM